MSIQLKPQHQDSVIGRMIETKKMLKYYESTVIPEINELKEWEQKEYWSNYRDYQKQFEDYKQYIKEKEASFNLLLCQYNLSVATFVYTLNHC